METKRKAAARKNVRANAAPAPGDAAGLVSSAPVPPIKFTFIMPCYAERPSEYMEIAGAIGSILAQTDSSWELIAVHDGPNETIRQMCIDTAGDLPKIRHDRIRFVPAPYRGERGGHASVETVRTLCRGEFVAVLNGDNVIRPDYVKKMYDPEADIVTCQVLMRDLPGIILSGRGFIRGRIDRLNYAVKAGIIKYVPHQMHTDADYDWLMDCIEWARKRMPVRVKHVDEVLGEHR